MYVQRVEKLREKIVKEGCEAFLVEDPINLYYLTGIDMSSGRLLVLLKEAFLFVDSRYYEVCKKNSPFTVVLAENGLPLKSLLCLKELEGTKVLGFSSALTSYSRYLQIEEALKEHNQTAKNPLQLKPLENPITELRAIKDAEEIDLLRQAAQLGVEGFDFVQSFLKEGVSEQQVATELEIFWKRKGAKGVAFDPIIAFGANSSMPHHRAGSATLKQGDAVLIDIGVLFHRYHSDMTRVIYFGEPLPKMLEIHAIVLEAQQRALQLCKPGTTLAELDVAARGWIAEKGFGDTFKHGLGHGVGLEIHELPSIRQKMVPDQTPLVPGMVITIEPGIYLPGIGGVRIEDTVVITEQGHENLTPRKKAAR